MSAEHLVNGEFDLSLRRGWTGELPASVAGQIRALSLQGMLFGDEGETVLVAEPVPGDFLDFLRGLGISHAEPVTEPSLSAGGPLEPFGWNRSASELAGRYRHPARHPPLAVVKKVNGRRFSAALEAELDPACPVEGVFTDLEALEGYLAGSAEGGAFVVKAEHGNAALANRRLAGSGIDSVSRRLIAGWLRHGEPVVLERWLPRLRDLSVTFELLPGGRVEGLEIHEVFNTAEGSFIGAFFPSPHDAATFAGSGCTAEEGHAGARTDRLPEAGREIAKRLAAEGYYGPVCLDAFEWGDPSAPRLRLLSDLNARKRMSWGAGRLWRSWGGERAVYWRLFNTSKRPLPTLEKVIEVLGDDAFDPSRREGTLLTSPPRGAAGRVSTVTAGPVSGEGPPLPRVGVLFAGGDRDGVLALEGRFRRRFEI